MTQVVRQRLAGGVLLVCLMALVPLATRALRWLPAAQERRVAGMPTAELEALVRREPDNVPALLALGRRLSDAGRYAEALVPLQSAAGQSPDDGRVREAWAMAQIAGGHFTGAFGQLTQFAQTHPGDADGRRALGRFYQTQRSYRRAVEELSAATKIAPGDAESWALLAAARHGLGDTALALEAARRACALRPESANDALVLASLCLESGRSDEALTEFARADRLAPRDAVVAREWARALLQSGATAAAEKAEPLARRAADAAPSDPDAQYLLGRALLAAGKPTDALATLESAATTLPPGTPVSTVPANAPTRFLDPAPAMEASQACLALGRADDARRWRTLYAERVALRETWQRLVDAARNRPSRANFQRLAEFMARRGDDAEVAKYLARARNSAIDAPPTLVATAHLLRREGYAERAVAVARRAVLLAPRSPETHDALGQAQLAAGRGHEAAVAFAHAAGWLPAREPGYRAQLDAFYRRRAQRPTEAQRLFAQARRTDAPEPRRQLLARAAALDPTDTDTLRLLARTLLQLDAREDALEATEKLLAITPEDALGLALRARLLLERPGSAPDLPLLTRDLARALREERLGPVYVAQGLLTLRQGKPAEAIPLLQQALEIERDDRAYALLVEAFRAAGNAAEAAETQRAWDRFRAQTPSPGKPNA